MENPAPPDLSAAFAEWRDGETTRLLILYGILIAVLFPAYHFVTNLLPGNIPDSLTLRLVSGGLSLGLVLLVWVVPGARRYSPALQFANMTFFLIMLLAVLVNSGSSNWFLTGIVIGLFGTQFAFLSSRDLVLAYSIAITFQIAYSALRGSFQDWANLYAIGVVFFSSVICVASGMMRVRAVQSEVRLRLRLRRQAITDGLTGTLNRNGLNETIDAELARAQRDGKAFALVYVDLNYFKRVNDSHGHDVGDVALAAAAERLRSVLAPSQLLARIGGDEFVILDTSEDATAVAAALVPRVERSFGAPFHITGVAPPIVLGASCGIALYPRDGCTRLELLAFSDKQMYSAKRERMHRRSSDAQI